MKIAVLVSGGVDSSVALQLLKKEGYDVTAFYLKIWLEDETAFLGTCPWEEDLMYVRQLCDQLDVPLDIVSLQKPYHDRVISYVLEEVRSGRTPNPDILCNQQIKFGAFFDAIDDTYEAVASGHYAQIEEKSGIYYLKKAPDPIKDQTYFLTLLKQSQLSRIMFPIGKYSKQEVRDIAQQHNLPTQKRKDSQGLCFLGKIEYDQFIQHHLGQQAGDIIDAEHKTVLGKHSGYWFYTIGQRHGLELSGGPWYVVDKDIQTNTIVVSHQNVLENKTRSKFEVENFHWITKKTDKRRVTVKVRHGATEYPCEISCSVDGTTVHIELIGDKEAGIAPGQFSVLYDGDYCLGGGVVV